MRKLDKVFQLFVVLFVGQTMKCCFETVCDPKKWAVLFGRECGPPKNGRKKSGGNQGQQPNGPDKLDGKYGPQKIGRQCWTGIEEIG